VTSQDVDASQAETNKLSRPESAPGYLEPGPCRHTVDAEEDIQRTKEAVAHSKEDSTEAHHTGGAKEDWSRIDSNGSHKSHITPDFDHLNLLKFSEPTISPGSNTPPRVKSDLQGIDVSMGKAVGKLEEQSKVELKLETARSLVSVILYHVY